MLDSSGTRKNLLYLGHPKEETCLLCFVTESVGAASLQIHLHRVVAAPAFHTDRNHLPGAPYLEGMMPKELSAGSCPCPRACSDPLVVLQSPRRAAELWLLAKLRKWH